MAPPVARGAAMLVAAMAGFALSDAMAKKLSSDLSPVAIAWFRYLLLLATVLPLAVLRPATWRSRRPLLQGARAAALVASAVLFLFGIRALPIAEATAMVFASPLFVTLLSLMVLRERVAGWRWAPLLLGFAGVLVVVRPGFSGFGAEALLPIGSSMAWACAVIVTRQLGSWDSAPTTMLYSAIFGTAGLSLMLPGIERPAVAGNALLLLAMASCWCCAQWLTIAAYRTVTPVLIAPFAYSQLIWAALLGWLLMQHVPDATSLAGMAMILMSGLAAAFQAGRAVAPTA